LKKKKKPLASFPLISNPGPQYYGKQVTYKKGRVKEGEYG
jgi:hypothetical protein